MISQKTIAQEGWSNAHYALMERINEVTMTGKQRDDITTHIADLEHEFRAVLKLLPDQEKLDALKERLTQISLGVGAFNRDPIKHAENVITENKETAAGLLVLIKDMYGEGN